MQPEQGYLSQDKLALLFIRDQTVGHSTFNIQTRDLLQSSSCICSRWNSLYILHSAINVYIKDSGCLFTSNKKHIGKKDKSHSIFK
jgi:hypothetical protein